MGWGTAADILDSPTNDPWVFGELFDSIVAEIAQHTAKLVARVAMIDVQFFINVGRLFPANIATVVVRVDKSFVGFG